MTNIWNFYNGKNQCKNIYEHIQSKQISILEKINPVILLFDNEQISDKPLKKFLKSSNLKLTEKETSKNIVGNLFLQTIPLCNSLQECDIEDLYKKELLDITINGKKFDKSEKKDSNKFFGKHIFSMYVKNHYTEINFDNFLPLLDSINKLC